MDTVSKLFGVVLLAILLHGAGGQASEPAPALQAWAVRLDGPTDSIQASGMDVAPSGDVYLAGYVRSGGYYLHDILITRRSPSGSLVWEQLYEPPEGPSANEQAFGIVVHGANIYVAGSITSPNGEDSDYLLLKYRDSGELEWAVRSDGPGHSNDSPSAIAVDGQGNVLVLGESVGTHGSLDLVVLKYGTAGELHWTYSYDGPERSQDRAVGMRVDPTGNIHVAGILGPWGEKSAVVTLKLDPDGHELWTAVETSANPYGVTPSGLDIDSAGHVVTVGTEGSYCVTWKYDAQGIRQWMARYRAEEPASMQAVDVRFDASGKILATANLYGSGMNDTVVIKYDGDGQQLWASRIFNANGSTHLNAMDLDSEGNTYLTMSPAYDVVMTKVSPEGAQLWSVPYNSEGFFSDYGEFLEVTSSGDIFMAGRSTYFTESFVSLVKFTQQAVTGFATAVVTPALHVVDPGADVVFRATIVGPEPTYFQWRRNGRPIANANGSTFSLPNAQAVHRGDYSVIVYTPAGETVSPEARLSVRVPPEVVVAPVQTLAYLGTDTAFAATITGNDFATLQWRHNGANIPGATNETLRLVDLNAEASGTYEVVVSTFGGTSTSSAAGLKISREVQLIGTTPHQSSIATWDYAPQLWVQPDGQSFIAARSNHLSGANIVLHKHAPHGELLWTSVFQSAEFTNAEPSRLILDGAGNIYISGLSRQPNLPAAWAVLKFDPEGQLLWSRLHVGPNPAGSIHTFAVDSQGNCAIAILGAGVTTVYRYNPAGDLQWSFADPLPDNDTIALAVHAPGETYLGTTLRVGDGQDSEARLRKFDPSGAILWTRPYAEGHFNRLGALAVDAEGNLVVAGTGELADVPDSRMFVQKYSSSGQKLWETRTGSGWQEISYILALGLGSGNEISVLTRSDDDYPSGEESGITRIRTDGRLRYRIAEREILPSSPSQLALDHFGNVYLTGWGGRVGTEADAATAKYDAYGSRHWLVHYDGGQGYWQNGLAVGADAAGDIRVLSSGNTGPDANADFSLIHYRPRDPASTFRLQLIAQAGGTFHLHVPAQEPFRIEASADLQSWEELSEEETQQLLQPGAQSFAEAPKRFFRLIFVE